ncbi:hypothetical protein [Actinomycetospora aeridis]|uniref:Regulatory protein RecX n=1 Tax=Actinomycetospora aeridis TaxID=3129231 RepID=A0ABU8NAV9_9PSEU
MRGRGQGRRESVDEVIERLVREGRFSEATAERKRVVEATSFRMTQRTARAHRSAVDRSRRSGAGAEAAAQDAATARLIAASLEQSLARHPEFADPEVVRWLAPTRRERLVDRVRRRWSGGTP